MTSLAIPGVKYTSGKFLILTHAHEHHPSRHPLRKFTHQLTYSPRYLLHFLPQLFSLKN